MVLPLGVTGGNAAVNGLRSGHFQLSLSQALTFNMPDLSFGLAWPEICASIGHMTPPAVEAIGCEWGIILDQEQINSFTAGNTFSCFSLSPIFLSSLRPYIFLPAPYYSSLFYIHSTLIWLNTTKSTEQGTIMSLCQNRLTEERYVENASRSSAPTRDPRPQIHLTRRPNQLTWRPKTIQEAMETRSSFWILRETS